MFIGRFVVELSDGKQVIEKFPGEFKSDSTLHMGWNQLKEFCAKHDLRIVKMHMRFRNFSHYAPDNAEDYFINMQQQAVQGVKVDFFRGLGFKKGADWFIVWLDQSGVIRNMEVRRL